jgi:hypothetical protein
MVPLFDVSVTAVRDSRFLDELLPTCNDASNSSIGCRDVWKYRNPDVDSGSRGHSTVSCGWRARALRLGPLYGARIARPIDRRAYSHEIVRAAATTSGVVV